MPPNAITVLLADDHLIVREGLRALLDVEQGTRVIGEAGDGRETAGLARKLRPAVIAMDIGMPLLNGLEATSNKQTAAELQISIKTVEKHRQKARHPRHRRPHPPCHLRRHQNQRAGHRPSGGAPHVKRPPATEYSHSRRLRRFRVMSSLDVSPHEFWK